MTRTTWIIGLGLLAAAALQLTLMATDVAGIPPDDRGKPGGAPASIQLTPDPRIIQCDGVAASTVTVRVTDSRGRAVPDGTLVYFDAQYGFVEPVEAATQRGEASTQASLYEYARNFAGQTGVDVFVDGGLRASIGIDCAPEGPPCDPATPPPHPQSPPCPEPGTCNFPFSPPVHSQSPPCPEPTPGCNIPFSPPLHVMSPPCGTPTPEPCHPASPPCGGQSEMRIDLEPETPGVQFRAPKPIGTPFRVGVNVTFASEPYSQYGWVIEWPNAGLRFDDAIFEVGPALGMERCSAVGVFPAPIDPDYDSAVFGTCGAFRAGFGTDYVGEITQFTFTCLAPGFHMINLVGRSAGVLAPSSSPGTPFSALLRSGGGLIETTTEGALVFCEEEAPPIGFGTIRFESYDPVNATVGVPFELPIEAVDASIPYQGYQWLAVTSAGLRVTAEVPAQLLFDLCTGDPDEVAPNEFYGGCIRLGASIPEAYLGRLATLMLVCASPGDKQVRLSSNPPFGTALLTDTGSEFGGPDTSNINVTCVAGAPTTTPTSTGLRPFPIDSPTPTPAPQQRGGRGLQ